MRFAKCFTVLNGVIQLQDSSLCLRIIANITVPLSCSHHDTLLLWTSYNGWKDTPRSLLRKLSCSEAIRL